VLGCFNYLFPHLPSKTVYFTVCMCISVCVRVSVCRVCHERGGSVAVPRRALRWAVVSVYWRCCERCWCKSLTHTDAVAVLVLVECRHVDDDNNSDEFTVLSATSLLQFPQRALNTHFFLLLFIYSHWVTTPRRLGLIALLDCKLWQYYLICWLIDWLMSKLLLLLLLMMMMMMTTMTMMMMMM